MRRSCVLFVILLAMSSSGNAQEPKEPPKPKEAAKVKSIEVLAGRELTLRPSDGDVYEARVPIRVVPPEAFANLSLQTVSVLFNGRLLDPGLVTFSPDKGEVTRLVLSANLAKMPNVGVYAVKVQVTPHDATLAAPPVLDFSLTRPAGEFQALAPLRFERVVILPWKWSCWHPAKLTLTEKSGKSPLDIVPETWTTDLRSSAGLMQGRITFKLPDKLSAGGQGEITVKEMDPPALGKSTGTLVVRSPQITNEVFETAIEVTSRAWLGWLLVTIVLGIVIGYVVRTELENRRRRLQADVAGRAQLDALTAAIDKEKDTGLQGVLKKHLKALEDAVNHASATPATIEAAATLAETKLAEALKNYDDAVAALRTSIATLRTDLGRPDQQAPQVLAFLNDTSAQMSAAETKIKEQQLTEALAIFEPLREDLRRHLKERVLRWKLDVQRAFTRCGLWPDVKLETLAGEIQTTFNGLDSKTDLKAFLAETEKLQGQLQIAWLDYRVQDILTLASDFARHLGNLNDASLKPSLDALNGAIDATKTEREAASSEKLAVLAEKILLLHEKLTAALRAAVPKKEDGSAGDSPTGLATGEFVAAWKEIERKRTDRIAESPGGVGTEGMRPTQAQEFAFTRRSPLPSIQATDRSDWSVTLDAPAETVAGKPILLRARLIASPGSALPQNVRIRWFFNDKAAPDDDRNPLEFQLVEAESGTLEVRVEAIAANNETRAAPLTLHLQPAKSPRSLDDLRNELKKTECLQNLISGVLIAAIGTLLYRNIFIGDLGDFATAFFWGFTTDIGLAKLRELATPLAGRVPTTIPPRT